MMVCREVVDFIFLKCRFRQACYETKNIITTNDYSQSIKLILIVPSISLMDSVLPIALATSSVKLWSFNGFKGLAIK